jgi:hypothetical protein
MSVPDHFFIVQQTYNTGHYNLALHADHARFVDDVVVALNGYDEQWGHLKKKPGQTALHGHGEDSTLYKLPDGTAWAVDFIGGAGGPSPTLRWGPDPVAYYTHADWLDPADHDGDHEPPAPPSTPIYPSYEALGGDAGGIAITRQLEADYKRAGRPGLDGDCGAWQQRVSYDFLTGVCATVQESIAKHRAEWLAALGLPPS